MALFENIAETLFEEAAGPWVLGIGALLVAPVALPALRPLAKSVVKNSLVVASKARETVAEVTEQWGDASWPKHVPRWKPPVKVLRQ
ncbi:MAG: DUF5132 domain-containing protein [Chloroflexaceae bacterium]|nr:DUF5132 domain-containing protein [Chloroflexaceae bacterium]